MKPLPWVHDPKRAGVWLSLGGYALLVDKRRAYLYDDSWGTGAAASVPVPEDIPVEEIDAVLEWAVQWALSQTAVDVAWLRGMVGGG